MTPTECESQEVESRYVAAITAQLHVAFMPSATQPVSRHPLGCMLVHPGFGAGPHLPQHAATFP